MNRLPVTTTPSDRRACRPPPTPPKPSQAALAVLPLNTLLRTCAEGLLSRYTPPPAALCPASFPTFSRNKVFSTVALGESLT